MLGPPFLNFHDQSLAADSCSKENAAAVAGAHKYVSGQADSADGWSETDLCSKDKGETHKSPGEKQR